MTKTKTPKTTPVTVEYRGAVLTVPDALSDDDARLTLMLGFIAAVDEAMGPVK